MDKPSLTLIIPAYNEVKEIRGTYKTALKAINETGIKDYELIIATNTARDGSHDGTPDVADKICEENSRVKHMRYNYYAGLGLKYRNAAMKATKEYIGWIPGDNDTTEESLLNILNHVGDAPIIAVYTKNPKARPFYMRLVSKGFVKLCNLLFGLKMKYYNGICVFKRELLQGVPMSADNPAFMSEILVYLLKSGYKYIEVPQEIKYTPYPGKTFRFKSVIEVLSTLIPLFWKIRFKKARIKVPEILGN